MVNSGGQLYTIEGLAASLILLLTAYLVVNSTSVYTPGDAHISDMQLEVTGSDALNMMTHVSNISPDGTVGKSPLQLMIETGDSAGFKTMFNNIVNNKTASGRDRIQFAANVSYVRSDGSVNITTPIGMTRSLTGGEHAVRVSKWLIVEKQPGQLPGSDSAIKHAVLVEVLLWRD
jgi:hypothetical protein